MGGGLMQLVAYGAQDIYLTGNPQITFFKVVYRRHTNFSMESIKQSFNGDPNFGATVSATISRNGDLIHRMYLEHSATFTNNTPGRQNLNLVERYGDSLIKECEIEIGGQRIDKHTSMWNRVYSDLTQFNPTGHFGGTYAPSSRGDATGNGTLYQLMTGNGFGLNSDAAPGSNYFAVNDDVTVNGFIYDEDNGVTVNKIFLPLKLYNPEVLSMISKSIFNKVVFPDPEGPITETKSPLYISKHIFIKISLLFISLFKFLISIISKNLS